MVEGSPSPLSLDRPSLPTPTPLRQMEPKRVQESPGELDIGLHPPQARRDLPQVELGFLRDVNVGDGDVGSEAKTDVVLGKDAAS